MTQYEKIVVSAYTGILLVDNFIDLHRYIEEKLGRSVFTHELASNEVWEEIQEKTKLDLLKICEI